MIYSTGDGSHPVSVVSSDLNNDIRLDLIIANQATDQIGIFYGFNYTTFQPYTSYSTDQSSEPSGIVVIDFNDDTHLDIAATLSNDSKIAVLLGYGNGSFSNMQSYSTGNDSAPYSAVIIDINDDHRLDIIVANNDGDSVGIFFGSGNGTFQNQVKISTGLYSKPLWISVGDFNRDNQLDIVAVRWNYNDLFILFGPVNGSSTRNSTYLIGSGARPLFVCTDDFNRDSYLDIVVVNSGTNDITIFFGLGDGTFLQGRSFSTGFNSNPNGIAIGDFNNDSRLDITVANYGSNNIVVLIGDANEPFGNIIPISTGQGSQPHSVSIADFNKDGQMDIVVVNYGANNVGVLLGYPCRVFGTMMTYSTGIDSSPYSVALDDLNNDQTADIVVSNSQSNNIMIMFGIGNGSFTEGIFYSTGDESRPYEVVINDMNNDHLLDLIITNSGTSNIFILYELKNQTFGNESVYPLGYGYKPYSIAVSDLNEDGQMDIVVACYGSDHVEILFKRC